MEIYYTILKILMQYIGPIVFIVALMFYRKEMRIDFGAIARFMAFLLSIYTVKIIIIQYIGHTYIDVSMKSMAGFSTLPIYEDAPFVLLPLAIASFFKNKWSKYAIWGVFSAIFAMGHISYGYPWAIMTFFAPYFVSRKYGLKYGFGTTMLAHVIFDVWQTLFLIFLNVITIIGL